MAKVECEVHYCVLENDKGYDQDSVQVTCTRCNHEVESYGQSERSVRRCFFLLKEECPRGERNYYTAGEAEEDSGPEVRILPPPKDEPQWKDIDNSEEAPF